MSSVIVQVPVEEADMMTVLPSHGFRLLAAVTVRPPRWHGRERTLHHEFSDMAASRESWH